jgi:O-methyltransferase involved in polyketide biosynthesis
MTKTKVQLGPVQETLLIPLWARAVELQKAAPIIADPKSAEMMATIDYDFGKFAQSGDSQIGCCLRGMMLDTWVMDYLQQQPQGTIVELGAGLNTRFERVDNGQLRWFDLDLPDVMELRQQFFQDSDRRQSITTSALDPDWMAQIPTSPPPLFVAEGVLMYLPEADVKRLFQQLGDRFPGATFIFDSMSPLMVKNQKQHDAMKVMEARFVWGIADIRSIQQWDDRYQVQDVLTFCDPPLNRYWSQFSLKSRILYRLPVLRKAYRLARTKLTIAA